MSEQSQDALQQQLHEVLSRLLLEYSSKAAIETENPLAIMIAKAQEIVVLRVAQELGMKLL